ncbi:hypothetical protein [Facklamia lactis]|uniref:hypothetical protein n=1 Tax=Facklamia lactis TaxID=2749967 RepID=UPI0018CD9B9D|nr:hypothetical protein [Facklamia lactis]MBG9979440.1 hypothetical protein [Facklamia lactis]
MNHEIWGTYADWMSALLSGIALIIAVYQSFKQNDLKFDLTVYFDSQTKSVITSVVNKNEFDIKIQRIGHIVYLRRFKVLRFEYLSKKHSQSFENKETTIERQHLYQYNQQYVNIEAFRGIKYVFVKPVILDSTGKYRFGKSEKILARNLNITMDEFF